MNDVNINTGILAKLVWDGGDAVLPHEMGAPRKDQLLGTPREQLSEMAGRVCYDSVGSGRSSNDYHKHIKDVGHLSVYEHAAMTVEIGLPLNASVFLNRPGFWVKSVSEMCFRVTFNPRAILEWDLWSTQIGVDDKIDAPSSFKIGDVLAFHAELAYPMILGGPRPGRRDGLRIPVHQQGRRARSRRGALGLDVHGHEPGLLA